MEALVRRQVRNDETRRLEPSPTPESDEDHVADRGRDQARQQRGDQAGSGTQTTLDEQHAGDERATEQCRDRRERAGAGEDHSLRPAEAHHAVRHDPHCGPECDHGHLGTEHRPERERADRGQHDTGNEGWWRRRRAQPLERPMAAVTGQERAREDDEQRPQNGQSEDEEPRRRGVSEGGRELMPQPVLERMDHAKEEGRGQRRRDPDQGGDADEAQVLRGRRRCLGWAIHPQPG